MSTETAKPKIVLVHGAWLDGSSWVEVIKELAHAGYEVHAVQLPLTSFEDDVNATTRVIDHAGGPVVLVGHSYAGAVISSAGHSAHVHKLVYIAALAAQPGQPVGALLWENPPAAPMQTRPDADGFLWADFAGFQESIGHDVHRGILNLTVAAQKPMAAQCFDATIAEPAWQSKPSWYLVATEDRILSPITQQALAKRIHATVHECATSHLPQYADPKAVAAIITAAAS